MSPIPEETKVLAKRWGLNPSKQVELAVAIILENQEKWFDMVAAEIPDSVAESFGDDWRDKVYESIKQAWFTSPIPEIAALQPFTKVIGDVMYMSYAQQQPSSAPTPAGANVPTISMNIARQQVQVQPRKVKARLTIPSVLDKLADNAGTLLESLFVELLDEVTREILGTLYWNVKGSTFITETTKTNLVNDISRGSHHIHRRSMRAPANNLIANRKMLQHLGFNPPIGKGRVCKVGVHQGKLNVYLDDHFPDAEMMLWYHGRSILDSAVVYTPYNYNFYPWDSENNEFVGRVRHKITLIKPEYVHLLRINVLDQVADAVS